jgi:hypothetical protein
VFLIAANQFPMPFNGHYVKSTIVVMNGWGEWQIQWKNLNELSVADLVVHKLAIERAAIRLKAVERQPKINIIKQFPLASTIFLVRDDD